MFDPKPRLLYSSHTETWLSGRKYLTANEAGLYRPRGFESHRLRSFNAVKTAERARLGDVRVGFEDLASIFWSIANRKSARCTEAVSFESRPLALHTLEWLT